MADIVNIWDRQPDEPSLWYERFERYRLVGPGRSIEETWRTSVQQPKAKLSHKQKARPSARWYATSARWNWQQRAEAWDVAELASSKHSREDEYRAALESHRDRSRTLAQQNLVNALKTLELVGQRLMTVAPNDIPIKLIPTYLRAAADVAERSLNAEAHALGLDQLLGTLSDDHEPDQTES